MVEKTELEGDMWYNIETEMEAVGVPNRTVGNGLQMEDYFELVYPVQKEMIPFQRVVRDEGYYPQ